MIDKSGVERVRQEIEALCARMQTRQQELGMEALIMASEGDLRAILDDYHDSAAGRIFVAVSIACRRGRPRRTLSAATEP